MKAAARQSGIVKASFDRTKRLLEKHASSFTASQKAELREVLGTGEQREGRQEGPLGGRRTLAHSVGD